MGWSGVSNGGWLERARPWRRRSRAGGREALTYSDTLGVNCAQVAVLEESNQESLGGFLQREEGLRCPAKGLRRHHVPYLPHEPSERQLPQEQVRRLLVLANLLECPSARAVPSLPLGHAGAGAHRRGPGRRGLGRSPLLRRAPPRASILRGRTHGTRSRGGTRAKRFGQVRSVRGERQVGGKDSFFHSCHADDCRECESGKRERG